MLDNIIVRGELEGCSLRYPQATVQISETGDTVEIIYLSIIANDVDARRWRGVIELVDPIVLPIGAFRWVERVDESGTMRSVGQ
jgi:hypothetical protein